MTRARGSRVPALILKIGRYPLHSGGVAAVRTLGRMGVPVYAITEDRFTPAALSRYCTRRFDWRTTGHEEPAELAEGLAAIGRRIGRPAVVVPVDDEAAVLVAEHAGQLAEHFLFPQPHAGLPRQLASKHGLFDLCRRHGVPAPASQLVSTREQLVAYAEAARFPVVVKNAEPWVRRRAPVVSGTTVLPSRADLLALTWRDDQAPTLLLQEFLPPEAAEDWIVHLYCDARSGCLVLFTGVKVRSWPPNTGATACGVSVPNPGLARLAARFCQDVGFQGVADLDLRYDRRDGQYKLVDFNPRMGNQFRLFRTTAGVDVIRAAYLDLTGSAVPAGQQVNGRKIVVEHIDLLARIAGRGSGYRTTSVPARSAETELAWLALDDPLPFAAMVPRFGGPAWSYLTTRHPKAAGTAHTGKEN